ncbi:MAG: response regulator [Gemmatimonadales bacterium]|nr:response regulator [Gemmatimonadales bacterium]NIN11182.1 response regulator [Gemmatimonadales bacterium]NIN49781.1 response regulator [Gemmatimonadales bacterium]NIP07245.1 response regulator [Gemmatimonadales bacterium]NIR00458.1 response regulator [Gemmatimonadales bacterium]
MTLVLVVDDVAAMAEQYAYDLKRVGGYETVVAGDGRSALYLLEREAVDCMILDLEMPGMDGFDVLRALAERDIRVPVIVYTGTGNYDRCVQAVRLGAEGFVDKEEPVERVVQEIEHSLERRRLEREVASLRRDLGADSPLLGDSKPMLALKDAIARVAPVPSPVLIVGESGSGKELVARELHRMGPGEREPFIPINSAALPESLVESELFGHERGAFTGATATRKGAFEMAAGGTLFLDEVRELPLGTQAKLLRVLEEHAVSRVGSTRMIRVDTRVVAATNRDLEAEVAAGRFRQDLYYRLNVHVLTVPPLRERLSDIPALVHHLLETTCRRYGVRNKALSGEALDLLMAHDWRRNNVRELRNVVERLIIAVPGDTIGAEHVPVDIRTRAAAPRPRRPATFQGQKAEAERRIVLAALERNDWHITRTAEELGLADHASLLKIMRRHGIKKKE